MLAQVHVFQYHGKLSAPAVPETVRNAYILKDLLLSHAPHKKTTHRWGEINIFRDTPPADIFNQSPPGALQTAPHEAIPTSSHKKKNPPPDGKRFQNILGPPRR